MNTYAIALISSLNNKYAATPINPDKLSPIELTYKLSQNINANTIHHFITKEQEQEHIYKNLVPNQYSCINNKIENLISECLKTFKNYENIIFLYSNCPLNDTRIINELITLHENEIAEYSFTENFPDGIGAEIINYHILNKLYNIVKTQNPAAPLNRKSIEQLIHIDINQYDVEVLVSNIDFRKERLELVCSNKRNFLIVKQALEYLNYKENISINDIDLLIKEKPLFMRSIPAYIEIEITNNCQFLCKICPRTNILERPIKDMTLETYKLILEKLAKLTEECFICLSLMGEPFLHPDIISIIENTLSYSNFSLIIESNGLELSYNTIDKLSKLDKNNKLFIILALDSPNKELYTKLRPYKNDTEHFDTIDNNAFYLLDKGPKNSYIQILRLKENNDVLDDFYKKWNAYKNKIILQKYNPYRRKLADRKAVDLAPLNRFPCWHLKRDMTILNNGNIAFCKQDINGEKIQGNIIKEDINTIWKRLDKAFIEDHKGNIDTFCEKCDEWFTYNF